MIVYGLHNLPLPPIVPFALLPRVNTSPSLLDSEGPTVIRLLPILLPAYPFNHSFQVYLMTYSALMLHSTFKIPFKVLAQYPLHSYQLLYVRLIWRYLCMSVMVGVL
jgi:hypothetical protein